LLQQAPENTLDQIRQAISCRAAAGVILPAGSGDCPGFYALYG